MWAQCMPPNSLQEQIGGRVWEVRRLKWNRADRNFKLFQQKETNNNSEDGIALKLLFRWENEKFKQF